ncbi:MAG: hypothetical protein IJA22_01305 [Clostridia bacterium]|nr:hypothetical protein [Clostridia bacterium]
METNNAERPTLKILARLAKKRMKYNELVKVDSITAFDKELEALKDKVAYAHCKRQRHDCAYYEAG